MPHSRHQVRAFFTVIYMQIIFAITIYPILFEKNYVPMHAFRYPHTNELEYATCLVLVNCMPTGGDNSDRPVGVKDFRGRTHLCLPVDV